MSTTTHALFRIPTNRTCRLLLPILLIGLLVALSGCAGTGDKAVTAITDAGTEMMKAVKAVTAFAAISLAVYWISFIVLFGMRNVWPEGYNGISQTWKAAAFITVGAVIGLPALLTWAGGIVDGGGFGA